MTYGGCRLTRPAVLRHWRPRAAITTLSDPITVGERVGAPPVGGRATCGAENRLESARNPRGVTPVGAPRFRRHVATEPVFRASDRAAPRYALRPHSAINARRYCSPCNRRLQQPSAVRPNVAENRQERRSRALSVGVTLGFSGLFSRFRPPVVAECALQTSPQPDKEGRSE